MSSNNLTVDVVQMALGAASLRQKVIADNIANVNSANHLKMQVIFEEKLAAALEAQAPGASSTRSLSLADLQPEVAMAPNPGSAIELDQEMVDLSANALRYQALTRGLSRYFDMAMSIATGRRS